MPILPLGLGRRPPASVGEGWHGPRCNQARTGGQSRRVVGGAAVGATPAIVRPLSRPGATGDRSRLLGRAPLPRRTRPTGHRGHQHDRRRGTRAGYARGLGTGVPVSSAAGIGVEERPATGTRSSSRDGCSGSRSLRRTIGVVVQSDSGSCRGPCDSGRGRGGPGPAQIAAADWVYGTATGAVLATPHRRAYACTASPGDTEARSRRGRRRYARSRLDQPVRVQSWASELPPRARDVHASSKTVVAGSWARRRSSRDAAEHRSRPVHPGRRARAGSCRIYSPSRRQERFGRLAVLVRVCRCSPFDPRPRKGRSPACRRERAATGPGSGRPVKERLGKLTHGPRPDPLRRSWPWLDAQDPLEDARAHAARHR